MKFLIFIFLIFFSLEAFNKSNDSPDLNYKTKNSINWNEWLRELKNVFAAENFKETTLKK